MNKKGKVSVEYLSHFQCGECKKWWSAGDVSQAKKNWFCPWCGLEQEVIDKTPKDREQAARS